MTDAPVADGAGAGAGAGEQASAAAPSMSARRVAYRRILALVSWSLVALVGAWLAVVLFGFEAGPLVWLVALTPWAVWVAVAALVAAVAARRFGPVSRAGVVSAGVALAAVALAISPLYLPALMPRGDGTVLTVATLNLKFGQADANAVVKLVEERRVDVLAVEELTPEAADALAAAGLATLLPYSVTDPREGYRGTGLYSREPISDPEVITGLNSAAVAGTIVSQGGGLRVVAVHPAAPGLLHHDAWSADLEAIATVPPFTGSPLLIAGDFNATVNHAGMRRLDSDGLLDAAEQAGAGFLPTFPSEGFPFPLAPLDHVLVRYTALVADQVDTVTVPGTDHRALVVEYTGP